MLALHVAEVFAGVAVVLATWWSVLITLVVPRGRSSWITSRIYSALRLPFRLLARANHSYERLDAVLAAQAPVILLGLLLGWLLLYLVGFALIFASDGAPFGRSLQEAGSSLFTLGFSAPTGQLAVVCAAAASGLVVVALQVGYLPTLYSAYNRRETLVTLLATRAGVPAWGPEILVRHANVGIVDSLAGLYAEWEIFGADLAESHTNYAILVHFRSPRPLRSWLIGLLAVLDSAALFLALAPSRAPSQARLCLRMGYISLREIARVLGERTDEDPRPDQPIRLSRPEFDEAVAYIRASGFPVERDGDEAWDDFRGWRVNYEGAALALARRTEAPPALWSGTRRNRSAPRPPHRPPDRRMSHPEGAPHSLPAAAPVTEASTREPG